MAMLAHVGRAVVLGDKKWTFHLAGDGAPDGAKKAEAKKLAKEALLQKRTEVCENAPGTFYNALESAKALSRTLGEPVTSRCCCGVDTAAAPHGTIKLPAPSSSYALDFFSGPKKPKIKALGIQSYQYLWDRLGADVGLSRCAALPGIQVLPPAQIKAAVDGWCATNNVTCPARRNNSDCARAAARPDFERESREDARTNGAALTVFVAYEKLPTPYEGGHVRTRQLLSWLCAAGHRVLLAHRDVKKRVAKFDPEPAAVVKDLNIAHCDDGNFAVFALDETMEGVSAHKLARQRVDIVVATTWFYRLSAPPIPALVIPLATQLGDIRRRKIPVVLTSDDVQHERARAVGAARGDDPTYWRFVREAERAFYGHADVAAVLAISDEDRDAFAALRAAPRDADADAVCDKFPGGDFVRSARRGAPDLGVLPYRAKIDGGTAKDGWTAHGDSFGRRADVAFVGGGTFANRLAVQWLLRHALPALHALSDADGGCADLRAAKLLLIGSAQWADEARAACDDALAKRSGAARLLCAPDVFASGRPAGGNMRKRPPHASPGVSAPGRVDDVSAALRRSRLFVAPAVVASGISTKVWLALEHGLPVATTRDGARGLGSDALAAFRRRAAPFVPLDVDGGKLDAAAAARFAPAAAAAYCNATAWRDAALAALAAAKDLESRAPWSGAAGPLGDLFSDPPPLACEAPPPATPRSRDDADAESLVGALRRAFDGGLAAKRGDCRSLMRASFP